MRRKLFTFVAALSAALSLVLFAATLILWVRSKIVGDVISWSGSDNSVSLFVMNGVVRVLHAETASMPPEARHATFDWRAQARRGVRFRNDKTWYGRLGFGFDSAGTTVAGNGSSGYARGGASIRTLYVPYWSVALVTAVLPLTKLRYAWRRRRRRKTGLCPVCGYDLRATPERCPECGAAPTTE